MYLLTAPIILNNRNLTGIYFVFLKKRARPNQRSFHTKFGPQLKDRKSSYEVRQILALFCNLIALILN